MYTVSLIPSQTNRTSPYSQKAVSYTHLDVYKRQGIRSVFLSDYANEYLFLKLNARVWKFHYQSLFAELNADSYSSASQQGNELTPKLSLIHI